MIGFGAGEPDFPTPDHIVEAAARAAHVPTIHQYTPAAGLPDLRAAIAAKTKRDSGYDVPADHVLVANGGKQALFNTFLTLIDPGDEVIVPAPYWVSYPEMVRIAGGTVVEIPTDEETGFKVTLEQLEVGMHRAHEDAVVRVAVEPDWGRVLAGRGARDRSLGAVERHLGRHRRDLRAPRLRRRSFLVDVVEVPELARTSGRHQRGSEDVRDDRLAGRLDDRSEGRDRRLRPRCSRTRRRTCRTSPKLPLWPRSPATSRRPR